MAKKHRIALFLILLSSTFSFAQDKIFKHEIGIVAASLKNKTLHMPLLTPSFHKTKFTFIEGITYKRYFNTNVFRSALYYNRTRENMDGSLYYNLSLNQIGLHLGYQKMLSTGKIQPYLGIELVSMYGSYFREITGGIEYFHLKETVHYNGIGIAHLAGMRVELSNRFSASIETSIEILSLKGKHKNISATDYYFQYGNQRFQSFNTEPLRLAINFSF